MSAVITVENLSKCYQLKHQGQKNTTLRDAMVSGARSIVGKNEGRSSSMEEFWALTNVSFDIQQGDRVGIIGRNGAGKSTLLKVLSRIVTPTKGKIVIDGRVASLLEVGTGFHGELSGRENIFLNGSILGMSKQEIRKKFDEIVAFAEVDKFLDTPVKRYSSGMYVRLAFAVAAHLEPEILIVDEVLAVGDAEFQRKCIGKMKDVSGTGRTVLFVSHNIGAVRSLCNKAILLEKGTVACYDDVDKVMPMYLGVLKDGRVNGILIQATALSASGEWETGTDMEVTISWDKHRFAPGWQCDIACYTIEGTKIFALESEKFNGFTSIDPEANGVRFTVRNIGFVDTDIRLDVGIKEKKELPYCTMVENALMLSPSNKGFPEYKRDDVINILPATCQLVRI